MSYYRNTAVSGNNAFSVDGTDSASSSMGKADTDSVSLDEQDIDVMEDMEGMVLSGDAYLDSLNYIAATNTCLAFGVFFIAGLLLAKMALGRFR